MRGISKRLFYQGLKKAKPVGTYEDFAHDAIPSDYLIANGATVSRAEFKNLFAVIGTRYGAGNGVTTFRIPDCRGVARRGQDLGRGYDRNRVLGSYQADDNKTHKHSASSNTTGNHTHNFPPMSSSSNSSGKYYLGQGNPNGAYAKTISVTASGNHAHIITVNSIGGSEARMKNIASITCIKY